MAVTDLRGLSCRLGRSGGEAHWEHVRFRFDGEKRQHLMKVDATALDGGNDTDTPNCSGATAQCDCSWRRFRYSGLLRRTSTIAVGLVGLLLMTGCDNRSSSSRKGADGKPSTDHEKITGNSAVPADVQPTSPAEPLNGSVAVTDGSVASADYQLKVIEQAIRDFR